MNRIEVKPKDNRSTYHFYDCECCVCGSKHKLTADVAHLYEDATEHQATTDTLIALCSNCNQAQARSHYSSQPNLNELFAPADVHGTAEVQYHRGNYRRSYAANRLAAYLYEQQGSYSKAMGCLTDAICALRPMRRGDLLRATILQAERMCRSHPRIGIIRRWQFVDRIALTLFDYGRWLKSAEVQTAAKELGSGIPDDFRDPDELDYDKDCAERREGLIRGLAGKLDRGQSISSTISCMVEKVAKFKATNKYNAAATHLDVARRLVNDCCGDSAMAHSLSESALEFAPKITNKWVLLEHWWAEANYFHARKDREKSVATLVQALHLYSYHPVVLEPVGGKCSPKQPGILSGIQRLGVRHEELIERGVGLKSVLAAVPLDLNDSAIDRIVANVRPQHGRDMLCDAE